MAVSIYPDELGIQTEYQLGDIVRGRPIMVGQNVIVEGMVCGFWTDSNNPNGDRYDLAVEIEDLPEYRDISLFDCEQLVNSKRGVWIIANDSDTVLVSSKYDDESLNSFSESMWSRLYE